MIAMRIYRFCCFFLFLFHSNIKKWPPWLRNMVEHHRGISKKKKLSLLIASLINRALRAHLCSSKLIINANSPFFLIFKFNLALSVSPYHFQLKSASSSSSSSTTKTIMSKFYPCFMTFYIKWLSKSLSIIYILFILKRRKIVDFY